MEDGQRQIFSQQLRAAIQATQGTLKLPAETAGLYWSQLRPYPYADVYRALIDAARAGDVGLKAVLAHVERFGEPSTHEKRERTRDFEKALYRVVEYCWEKIQLGDMRGHVVVEGLDTGKVFEALRRARDAFGAGTPDEERAAIRAWCAQGLWPNYFDFGWNEEIEMKDGSKLCAADAWYSQRA